MVLKGMIKMHKVVGSLPCSVQINVYAYHLVKVKHEDGNIERYDCISYSSFGAWSFFISLI